MSAVLYRTGADVPGATIADLSIVGAVPTAVQIFMGGYYLELDADDARRLRDELTEWLHAENLE